MGGLPEKHREHHRDVLLAMGAARQYAGPRGLTVEEIEAAWRDVPDRGASEKAAGEIFGYDFGAAKQGGQRTAGGAPVRTSVGSPLSPGSAGTPGAKKECGCHDRPAVGDVCMGDGSVVSANFGWTAGDYFGVRRCWSTVTCETGKCTPTAENSCVLDTAQSLILICQHQEPSWAPCGGDEVLRWEYVGNERCQASVCCRSPAGLTVWVDRGQWGNPILATACVGTRRTGPQFARLCDDCEVPEKDDCGGLPGAGACGDVSPCAGLRLTPSAADASGGAFDALNEAMGGETPWTRSFEVDLSACAFKSEAQRANAEAIILGARSLLAANSAAARVAVCLAALGAPSTSSTAEINRILAAINRIRHYVVKDLGGTRAQRGRRTDTIEIGCKFMMELASSGGGSVTCASVHLAGTLLHELIHDFDAEGFDHHEGDEAYESRRCDPHNRAKRLFWTFLIDGLDLNCSQTDWRHR